MCEGLPQPGGSGTFSNMHEYACHSPAKSLVVFLGTISVFYVHYIYTQQPWFFLAVVMMKAVSISISYNSYAKPVVFNNCLIVLLSCLFRQRLTLVAHLLSKELQCGRHHDALAVNFCKASV